eukprot:GEZU01039125.1.p1 GENE.GEZU01039125.1~~GEZU01039125.1.p1  ORF type:complete len:309 (-),score=70.53 GEZU01039125.1:150-1076(-)
MQSLSRNTRSLLRFCCHSNSHNQPTTVLAAMIAKPFQHAAHTITTSATFSPAGKFSTVSPSQSEHSRRCHCSQCTSSSVALNLNKVISRSLTTSITTHDNQNTHKCGPTCSHHCLPNLRFFSTTARNNHGNNNHNETAETASTDTDVDAGQAAEEHTHHKMGIHVGGAGIGIKNADMAIIFTCKVCETRSLKQFTKKSYTEGLVIVQCPGCKNLHLIADNFGWFQETIEEQGGGKNIEHFAAMKGHFIKKINHECELSPEDLLGFFNKNDEKSLKIYITENGEDQATTASSAKDDAGVAAASVAIEAK